MKTHSHRLRRGLVLGGHPVTHRHARILSSCLLLLLKALVVGHLLLLFVRHVAGVHTGGTGNIRLLGVDIAVANILWRLSRHLGRINAILVGSGVRCIQTGLIEKRRVSRVKFDSSEREKAVAQHSPE